MKHAEENDGKAKGKNEICVLNGDDDEKKCVKWSEKAENLSVSEDGLVVTGYRVWK